MENGQYLYNSRLLRTIEEQSEKLENKQRRKIFTPRLTLTSDLAFPVYEQYPRKEGRKAALEAINKAIQRITYQPEYQNTRDTNGIPTGEETAAAAFLYKRAEAYAHSPAGQRPDREFIPHPSTWFNQDRFLDDTQAWGVTHTPGIHAVKPNGKQSLEELYPDA